MAESKVHENFERLARRLSEFDIDFVLADGLAVGMRGHLRVTVDVDILTTEEGLSRFKDRWLGRGYGGKFSGSKGVKDVETGVSIEYAQGKIDLGTLKRLLKAYKEASS